MQNSLEPEFLSSHVSCVRKQVSAQTAVNTGTERNLYSPAPRARGGIQMPRPLWTPLLSRFLVINSLFGREQRWDVGSHGGQRAAWQPRGDHALPLAPKTTVPLRKVTPSPGHTEHPPRGQGCLSSTLGATQHRQEQLASETSSLQSLS